MYNLKVSKADQERHERFNNHPIIQKRGKLFRNWWNSHTLYQYLQLTKCPICGKKHKLICENDHILSHEEHLEMAREKYEEALHNEEDNKTLDEFREEIGWSTK